MHNYAIPLYSFSNIYASICGIYYANKGNGRENHFRKILINYQMRLPFTGERIAWFVFEGSDAELLPDDSYLDDVKNFSLSIDGSRGEIRLTQNIGNYQVKR